MKADCTVGCTRDVQVLLFAVLGACNWLGHNRTPMARP